MNVRRVIDIGEPVVGLDLNHVREAVVLRLKSKVERPSDAATTFTLPVSLESEKEHSFHKPRPPRGNVNHDLRAPPSANDCLDSATLRKRRKLHEVTHLFNL
jgi:hypothetical protein